MPPLPTRDLSPSSSWVRSSSRAQACKTWRYQVSSKMLGPRILSRMDPKRSHALWSQYAIGPQLTLIKPLSSLTSPRIALRSVDFPDPTGPTSIVRLDCGICRFTARSTASLPSFKEIVTSWNCTAGMPPDLLCWKPTFLMCSRSMSLDLASRLEMLPPGETWAELVAVMER